MDTNWITTSRSEDSIQGKTICLSFPQDPPDIISQSPAREQYCGTLVFKKRDDDLVSISVELFQPFDGDIRGVYLTESEVTRMRPDDRSDVDFALSFGRPASSILVCLRRTGSSDTQPHP